MASRVKIRMLQIMRDLEEMADKVDRKVGSKLLSTWMSRVRAGKIGMSLKERAKILTGVLDLALW